MCYNLLQVMSRVRFGAEIYSGICFQSLTFFTSTSIIDVFQGHKYAPGLIFATFERRATVSTQLT